MESCVLLHVSGNVLVAIHAQGCLTYLIGAIVAVAAGAFQFGMRIGHLARHQQGFNVRRRSDTNE